MPQTSANGCEGNSRDYLYGQWSGDYSVKAGAHTTNQSTNTVLLDTYDTSYLNESGVKSFLNIGDDFQVIVVYICHLIFE